MQKISYMGNGETTEFGFNFSYFENTDVVVTKNGLTASGYTIVGNSSGLDADIPYTGGTVVFETAPSAMDNITISRNLPLQRQYDYQPLVKIDPTTLNQDMNYLMETIKDLKDELDTLREQYTDIADKESTDTLLSRIDTISQQITDLNSDTQDIGGIPGIAPKITTLDSRTNGVLDYVIESQSPTAENNYTWYRKYKSGWIEQGGCTSGTGTYGKTTVTLPITMANIYYNIQVGIRWGDGANWYTSTNGLSQNSLTDITGPVADVTTTSFTLQSFSDHCWMVCGMAA